MKPITRCAWATMGPANGRDLMLAYHDTEWGKLSHDDRHLFEMLILEGAQAGLSWQTILNKREAYREAFDRFDPRKVAEYDARRINKLLTNPGIVRNRLKVVSAVRNAKAVLEIQRDHGSLDAYLWSFVGGKPIINRPASLKDIPAKTAESDAMSKALKKRGMNFVGSTICYAFMQAVGMVDDHTTDCFCKTQRRRATPVQRAARSAPLAPVRRDDAAVARSRKRRTPAH